MIKKKSTHQVKGKFKNLIYTRLGFNESEGMGEAMRKSFFGNKKIRSPQLPLDNVKFDKNTFLKLQDAIVWFGHSSLLLKVEGTTIVIDPVFKRASPFSFIGPKPFTMKYQPTIDDLPKHIDVLLLTHDHYDHLEYRSMIQLHKKVTQFFVPLKIKKILVRWGIPKEKIKEFDWYDSTTYKKIKFIFTPSRHFSGRGLTNRQSTLWGGWIITSKTTNIYHSGDSGYFDEFKKIGEKYGPFDFAFVENGQYDKAWVDIHMYPEDSVQAGIDANAKVLMPIHWGKYDLSVHPWKEPIERFVKEAKKRKLKIATPHIGEIFTLNKIPTTHWWKKEK